MQPWKEDKILHVGLESSFHTNGDPNIDKLKVLGAKPDSTNTIFLYLQWCRVGPGTESRSKILKEESCLNVDKDTCEANHSEKLDNDQSEYDFVSYAVEKSNLRQGNLYSLTDGDVFSPNICETKWIGHLDHL